MVGGYTEHAVHIAKSEGYESRYSIKQHSGRASAADQANDVRPQRRRKYGSNEQQHRADPESHPVQCDRTVGASEKGCD